MTFFQSTSKKLEVQADIADSAISMVNSLNYLALGLGTAAEHTAMPARSLSKQQKQTVDRLLEAVKHLSAAGCEVPPPEQMGSELGAARYDYAGEPILLMEDLVADRVIAAWPEEGQAAVQEAANAAPRMA